jgi:hypothetical protein
LRHPADSELIDAGSLDDQFLMAFTEDFGVGQPRRRAAAHGAFRDSHGVDLKTKRAAIARNPSSFGYSVSRLRAGPSRLSRIHSLDELCQEPKVRDLI